MRRILFYSVLLGVLCQLIVTPLWAADDKSEAKEAPAVTLEDVVVSGRHIVAPKAEEGVTLGSYQLKVSDNDRARTSSAADLLYNMPGVSLQPNGGVGTLPFLHGLGDDRIRLKVNGMDLIAACPNHMNSPLSYIDPTNVDTLDVMAGITPVSMGGDSIAGSIIVNSAALEFAKPGEGTLLKGQLGSFYRTNGNAFGANLSTTAATERFSIRYSGAMAKSDNYKAADDFKPSGKAASDREWLDGDEVGSSKYQTWNHELDMALRGEKDLLQLNIGLQYIPYEGFPNQRMDMTLNNSRLFNLHYTRQFQWGDLEARVYNEYTRHEMDFDEDKQFYYGTKDTILAPGMPMNTEGNNTGAMAKASIPLTQRDTLKVGIEAQRYRLDDWWPPSPSTLPSGYTSGGMAPDTFWNISDGKRDRIGVFAEWDARWSDQWLSQLGVRSDTVMMDTGAIHGYNNTAMYNGSPLYPATTFNNADRERTDNNFDVTALTRYTPTDTLAFELGYARKTRSPNLYERYTWSINTMAMEMNNFAGDGNFYVGNLNLKPEVANTVSATAHWHDAAKAHWDLKITPFYTYVQDYIDARRCPASVCGSSSAVTKSLTSQTSFVYLQYVNQSASLYGVDVSGDYMIAKTSSCGTFTATGLLNFVKGENRDTGDNLYNIMPLNATLALVNRLGKLTTMVEEQLVSAKTEISQVRNEVKTHAYGLLNLRGSYEWKMLRLDAGVENALNQSYDLPLGGAYVGQGATMSGNTIPWGIAMPGYGRTFYIAMTARF